MPRSSEGIFQLFGEAVFLCRVPSFRGVASPEPLWSRSVSPTCCSATAICRTPICRVAAFIGCILSIAACRESISPDRLRIICMSSDVRVPTSILPRHASAAPGFPNLGWPMRPSAIAVSSSVNSRRATFPGPSSSEPLFADSLLPIPSSADFGCVKLLRMN